jgi:hypothetical protein
VSLGNISCEPRTQAGAKRNNINSTYTLPADQRTEVKVTKCARLSAFNLRARAKADHSFSCFRHRSEPTGKLRRDGH